MPAMSSSAPVRSPGRFRRWFPIIALDAAILVIALCWVLPGEDLNRGLRVVGTMLTLMVLVLLLGGWLIFFSGWRWTSRLGTLLLVPAILFGGCKALVSDIRFDGDMVPKKFTLRWEEAADKKLADHRRAQAGEKAAPLPETLAIAETDFPEYRNRKRDGIVVGPALNVDWSAKPPKKLWGRQPVGEGYAGFLVVGGALVTIEQRGEDEVVACYDSATGIERWAHRYKARFVEPQGGDGPRATPTIADGKVYSLGATGRLVCLDLRTGNLDWGIDILEGNKNLPWAMAGSPLIHDNLVIVNAGAQIPAKAGQAVVAYDRATGKQVWAVGGKPAGYSSPQLATLCGKLQILLVDGAQVAGYEPATGKEIWSFPWEPFNQVNAAQPLVLENDRVFVSSGYGLGCALVQLTKKDDGVTAESVWKNRQMSCKFASPVYYQGYIYGLDEGILACLDPATGKRKWKGGRYGHGQLLLTGDVLVISAEDGRLVLVRATPDKHQELASTQVFERDWRTWNSHALANGIVYLRNDREMAAFDLRP